MIIIGAKGFAKEVLEILIQLESKEEICFFDNVTEGIGEELYGYKILKTEEEVVQVFQKDKRFMLGLGNPKARRFMCDKFEALGGELTSVISPFSHVGHFETILGTGINLMTGSVLTNSIQVGKGVLINLNCTIGHDCVIGDFVELSPGVHISGNCTIGENTLFGTGCVILPNLKIGRNSIIGAGSVVTKDVEEGVTVVGIPGKIL